ncbi:MAG: SMC-Scp complex subunit ScpB [Nitrospinota bacterium]
MEEEKLKSIVEALIFVSDKPVSVNEMATLLEKEVSIDMIHKTIELIQAERKDGGVTLQAVANGYQFKTAAENVEWIREFFKLQKGQRLGKAMLETLAIIAYRQPVTRAEIDQIRAVESGHSLRSLVDRKLIKSLGRKKTIGKPITYGTTDRFLEYFGLATLSELPTLEEFAHELDDKNFIQDGVQKSLDLDNKTEAQDLNDNLATIGQTVADVSNEEDVSNRPDELLLDDSNE